MGKIFPISLNLVFTPNTLGCYGLTHHRQVGPFGSYKNQVIETFSRDDGNLKRSSSPSPRTRVMKPILHILILKKCTLVSMLHQRFRMARIEITKIKNKPPVLAARKKRSYFRAASKSKCRDLISAPQGSA